MDRMRIGESMEKVLGKITSAEYGMCPDYPFLFGLGLYFSLDGGGKVVGCSSKYMFNISEHCKWGTENRSDAIAGTVDDLYKILCDAKVHHVSELIGKPVEVTLDGMLYKDFRILTEVL